MTIDQVTKWSCNYLSSHGYILKNNQSETVQDTPWSYVARFATSEGYIYLKHTPALLALEAVIIQIFHEQFHASVPIVIASNNELNCFLMKDAGKSLRTILKQKFDELLLGNAIDQFTSLQLAVAEYINLFLNIGVPDWRVEKLPDLYKELMAKKDMLTADGLTEAEISKLEALYPQVYDLCRILSNYNIKPTFVQPDFNDNNTLFDDKLQKFTMIDLGEIAISHPFFSLLNMLVQLKKHYGLTEDDGVYLRIRAACLKNFFQFETRENVLNALVVANKLFSIYAVLAGYRLLSACNKSEFIGSFHRHGKPGLQLREFIALST